MIVLDTLGYKLRAKSGWAEDNVKSAGWYVGYLETKDNVYYFSNCIQTNDFSKAKARIDIAYLILDELKLMRE